MDDPQDLHPVRCHKCQKPIRSGETYPLVRLPEGSEVPVHYACMGGKPVQD